MDARWNLSATKIIFIFVFFFFIAILYHDLSIFFSQWQFIIPPSRMITKRTWWKTRKKREKVSTKAFQRAWNVVKKDKELFLRDFPSRWQQEKKEQQQITFSFFRASEPSTTPKFALITLSQSILMTENWSQHTKVFRCLFLRFHSTLSSSASSDWACKKKERCRAGKNWWDDFKISAGDAYVISNFRRWRLVTGLMCKLNIFWCCSTECMCFSRISRRETRQCVS